MIYLDNAATTFPKPDCVYEALDKANRMLAFNAGRGESKESALASEVISSARKAISSLVPGSDPRHVIFTASATDALNLILNGISLEEGDHVYVSPFEHNAVMRPLNLWKEKGVEIHVIPFDKKTWELDRDSLSDEFVMYPPKAVIVSQISNVTGYELPYEEIFSLSKEYGSVNILDCAQGFGVFPVKNPSISSYLVFAGHKSLYGSFGVGGFVKMGNDDLLVSKAGGTGSDSLNPEMPATLPERYEAGSPNVVAISSLVTSISWLKEHDIAATDIELAKYAADKLRELGNVHVYLPENVESRGIISFSVDGYSAEEIGIILSEKGKISIRTGYHCAPLVHEFIGSLESFGTVRVSFGFFNTKEDADKIIEILRGI